MNSDLYKNALSAFNRGEYESAYNIISCTEESLSVEGERLLNECEKLIAEQYYYIIKEYLQQGDYNTARREKDKYAKTYGYNPKIESIEIPTKSNLSPSTEDSTEVKNGNTEQKSALKNIGLIFGIITVVLIGIIIAVWQYTNNEDAMPIPQQAQQEVENSTTKHYHTQSTTNTYEQRSNAIIQELTTKYGDKIQVEHKYPDLSKYCTFNLTDDNTEYLLVYDLDRKLLKKFNVQSLPTINAGKVCLFFFNTSINQNNNILISGNNGAYSMGEIAFTEYRLELNTTDWSVKEICSGNEITKTENGYIAHKVVVTRFNDDARYNEYTKTDVYYDLQGKLIAPPYNGNTYSLKGRIDNKYSITMQLTMQDNKIYGKYYYDESGSGNYLQLYGGVSDSGDVVLLEFNDKSQQTSNFIGRFTKNSFYGTFTNYKQIEMPLNCI